MYHQGSDEALREWNGGYSQAGPQTEAALETWLETVEAKFGKSIVGLPIIPCVLNNLPYARIGEHEGVYLYDYSSLKRFMTSGTLNPRSVATFGNEDRRELRTTLKYGRGESPRQRIFWSN